MRVVGSFDIAVSVLGPHFLRFLSRMHTFVQPVKDLVTPKGVLEISL